LHRSEGPVELARRALEYSGRPGEDVLELCGGSGRTLMVAEQAGRQAFLLDIDPHDCGVFVRRYESFAGGKADRAGR
jgi:DNA modification methylase